MRYITAVVLFIFFAFAQWWGLTQTPPDAMMGEVQKIMYAHVPAAWNSFLAFFVVFIASIAFLIRKKRRPEPAEGMFWDRLARSAAEVGVVLTGLTLCLGSIWGRPTWGVWWTWDARLTTTAILFFLYVGYLSFRKFVDNPERRAKLAAPLGVLIFLNVPIVYFSVKWWRTLHQVQSSPSTMDPAMVLALRLNAFAFLGVLILFIYWRYQIAKRKSEHEEAL